VDTSYREILPGALFLGFLFPKGPSKPFVVSSRARGELKSLLIHWEKNYQEPRAIFSLKKQIFSKKETYVSYPITAAGERKLTPIASFGRKVQNS